MIEFNVTRAALTAALFLTSIAFYTTVLWLSAYIVKKQGTYNDMASLARKIFKIVIPLLTLGMIIIWLFAGLITEVDHGV